MSMIALLVFALTAPSLGPLLPPRCTPELYALNLKVQRLIEDGRFDEAGQALDAWPYGTVHYTLGPGLPDHAEGVAQEAARIWSDATGGRLRFEPGPDPLIRIEFEERPTVLMLEPEWRQGVVFARIPVRRYGAEPIASRDSMIAGIARGFGMAAGLAPTRSRGSLMGIYLDEPELGKSPAPTSTEREMIHRISEARETLERAIRDREPFTAAVPRLSLEPKSSDAGTVKSGQVPRYRFTLRNTGNAVLELQTQLTCRCIFLDRIEPIPPGESVVITPALDTLHLVGRLDKRIIFHSNDPRAPAQELLMRVTAVPEYRVVPDALERVALADEGETAIDFYMYATPGGLLRVHDAVPNAKHVTAEVSAWNGEIFDPLFDEKPVRRTGFRVRVTFSPQFKTGLNWVTVRVLTDSRLAPSHDVTFQAQKGIVAQPKSVYFGGVDAGDTAVRTVTVSHPSREFKILSAEADGGPFRATWEPSGAEGRAYLLRVEYLGGPPGRLSGKVVLKTDHPLYPTLTVRIGGAAR